MFYLTVGHHLCVIFYFFSSLASLVFQQATYLTYVNISFSFVVSKYYENPNVQELPWDFNCLYRLGKMEHNYSFIPFLCDLVLLFSSSLWGQISTWQFLSTFLTHVSLSQNKLIGFSRSHVKDLAQWWLNFFSL